MLSLGFGAGLVLLMSQFVIHAGASEGDKVFEPLSESESCALGRKYWERTGKSQALRIWAGGAFYESRAQALGRIMFCMVDALVVRDEAAAGREIVGIESDSPDIHVLQSLVYANGIGVEKDLSKARALLIRACIETIIDHHRLLNALLERPPLKHSSKELELLSTSACQEQHEMEAE